MNKKFNSYAGNIFGIILFSALGYFAVGWYRAFAINVAIVTLLSLINSLQNTKIKLISYVVYLFSSLSVTLGSVVIYINYWNVNAVYIAKIGFIILLGALFIGSIVGIIISLYLIIKLFSKKYLKN
jgi:hypothetical protein